MTAPTHFHLAVCGISYKTSSLKQREPLQIGHDRIAEAHALFSGLSGVLEAIIVSTCNRVEFYFVADRSREPLDVIEEFYRQFAGMDMAGVKECFYRRRGKHAADHLFRVVAGIDSMVLGENQIAGQVKDAYSSACAVKAAGKILHRLFHHAFRVGKRVRTDTEMGKGACSVSSASVELLKSGIDRSTRPDVLFVGVNKMIALAASGLSKLHHGRFLFVNRTLEKAAQLSARYKADSYPLEKLSELLGEVDLVVTCTGASEPIVPTAMIDAFTAAHPDKILRIMDMAVPRDVAIDSGYHANVTVFDLEDVKRFMKQRQQEREAAMPEAEALIAQRLAEFAYWYDHTRREFAGNGLAEVFEDIRRQELDPILEGLPADIRQAVAEGADNLVRRLAQVKLRAQNLSRGSE